MPESPEPSALHRLYDLKQGDEVPNFLKELYPRYLPLWAHLGTGQPKCRRVDTGFDYGPSGFEPDCPYEFGLEVRLANPEAAEKATDTAPQTALYRLSDASGRLLYVGVSEVPLRRWKEHSKDKPWWPRVATLTLEWFDSRTEALGAEVDAIRSERPLHNLAHNSQHVA